MTVTVTETETETDRQTDRDRDRDRHTHRHTDRHTETKRDEERGRERDVFVYLVTYRPTKGQSAAEEQLCSECCHTDRGVTAYTCRHAQPH